MANEMPRPLYPPEKKTYNNCTGDCVGPKIGLDGRRKSHNLRGSIQDRPGSS